MEQKRLTQQFEGPHGIVKVWQNVYNFNSGLVTTELQFYPKERYLQGWSYSKQLAHPAINPVSTHDALAFSIFARSSLSIESSDVINPTLIEITL